MVGNERISGDAGLSCLWSISYSDKVDGVHTMLNSELTKFKQEQAEQYKVSLRDGIELAEMKASKAFDDRTAGVLAKMAAMESKVHALEAKLEGEREKAVVLAAAKIAPVAPQTGDERLNEIRGVEK